MVNKHSVRHFLSKAVCATFLTCLVTSCVEGDPESSLEPDRLPLVTEQEPTYDTDASPTVLEYGIVNALKNLPNAQKTIISASFVGFEQPIIRPTYDEDSFVEECSIDHEQPEPVDPLVALVADVEIAVGGNLEAGDELYLKDDQNTTISTMEKVSSDAGVGYVARISPAGNVPESLTVEIPGSDFPSFEKVSIPRADPIEAFSPLPGVNINKDTAFTWTIMETVEGQSPAEIDITIITDEYSINCVTHDDGAFSISDAQGAFDIDEFDGVLSTVARRTRHDVMTDESHIIVFNMTFLGVERIGDDIEDEIAAGEFGDLIDPRIEVYAARCELPLEDRLDPLLTDDYCARVMCEFPLEERNDPVLTDEQCEILGPNEPLPPISVLSPEAQCWDDGFQFSSTTSSMVDLVQTSYGLEVRQKLVPTSAGSTRGFGQISVQQSRSYTLTQRIFFEEGFDWGGASVGGKLGLGLYGGTAPTGGQVSPDGFSSRLMWRANSDGTARLAVYSYAYDRPAVPGSWGEDYDMAPHSIPVGRYFTVTMRVDANSPGLSDGSVQVWMDGQLMLNKQGIMWQKNGTPSIDKVKYSTFHGGNDASWAPDRINYVRFTGGCWERS